MEADCSKLDVNEFYNNSYKNIIEANPFLSKEEEIGLLTIIAKYKEGKQKEAAITKLFNSNLRLVLNMAHKYHSHCFNNISIEDIISAGSHGLFIAIEKFDLKYKTRLTTYSVPWIKLKILDLLTTMNSPVYIPSHLMTISKKYKEITSDKSKESLNDNEIMNRLNINENRLTKIKMAECKSISLNSPISVASGEETIQDVIEDKNAVRPSYHIENNDIKNVLQNELSKLSPIQREILVYRYINNDKEKLLKLGKKFGISGERIRQIEVGALKLLQKRIKKMV